MTDISSVVNEIKKENGVEAVYLFGSRVSGKGKPYSDIDLCVITDKNAKRESILGHSSDKIDTSVFWDLPLNIRFRVIKEGRPLYVKDKLKIQRIQVDTVLSYLDFKPLLARHFSRFLS
jgi:predicted nucleotidyltransferase